MSDHRVFRAKLRKLQESIGEAYVALFEEERAEPLLAAWRQVAALLAGRPGLTVRALDARLPGESLPGFLCDLIAWLRREVPRDVSRVATLRAVSELLLAHLGPDDDPTLWVAARAGWVRALDWSDERLGAEAELAAWVHDEPRCAAAWLTWSALHCEPGFQALPDDDPERAVALIEQGLRHVHDPSGRCSLLTRLGNLHAHRDHPEDAQVAHDEALALHERLCFGEPLDVAA